MRIVLDTAVLVSAALKQESMPGKAVLAVEQHEGLLKSLATEQQLFEVVARPYFASLIDPDTRDWLEKLMAAAERGRGAVPEWLWRRAHRRGVMGIIAKAGARSRGELT